MESIKKSAGVKEVVKMDIKQRIIASKTKEGWQNIPHVAGEMKPNVTEFMKILNEFKEKRKRLNPDMPKITINNVLLRVIAKAIEEAPHLNSILEYDNTAEAGSLIVLEKINITMPVMLNEHETVTLVVPDVGNKSIDQISEYVAQLREKCNNTRFEELLYQTARKDTIEKVKKGKFSLFKRIIKANIGEHKIEQMSKEERKEYYANPESERLVPEDINTGTLVVTNIGAAYPSMNGSVSLIDIVPPQTVALGLNPMKKEAIVVSTEEGDKIEIASVIPIIYAFDHRCFDFAHIMPFIKAIDTIFANPLPFLEQEFSDFVSLMENSAIYTMEKPIENALKVQ